MSFGRTFFYSSFFFLAAYGKAVLQMSSSEIVFFKRKEILFDKINVRSSLFLLSMTSAGVLQNLPVTV